MERERERARVESIEMPPRRFAYARVARHQRSFRLGRREQQTVRSGGGEEGEGAGGEHGAAE